MAYQNNNMSEEESLRRSHSKSSNFKLTLVCLLLALSSSALVAAVAARFAGILSAGVSNIALIATAALTLVSFGLLAAFKR